MRSRSKSTRRPGSQVSEQQNGSPGPSDSRQAVRRKGFVERSLHWINSKIYVYNVTFGLYMLDWWERLLFNMLVLLLLWFVAYSGSDFAVHCYHLASKALRDWPAAAGRLPIGINGDRHRK
ncbi:hypothetical protein R1flu_017236 [Riccia fluitans]|uniref:Serine palmitoyltransferase small subunit A n=1 Tax=Riccia fluitans TaxID=41844 RepID=A0ABD1XE73_9MARC